jgi:hypothetical protein
MVGMMANKRTIVLLVAATVRTEPMVRSTTSL